MDENMRCKNCKFSKEDKETFLLCCTNQKWNSSGATKWHNVLPSDFCSKF